MRLMTRNEFIRYWFNHSSKMQQKALRNRLPFWQLDLDLQNLLKRARALGLAERQVVAPWPWRKQWVSALHNVDTNPRTICRVRKDWLHVLMSQADEEPLIRTEAHLLAIFHMWPDAKIVLERVHSCWHLSAHGAAAEGVSLADVAQSLGNLLQRRAAPTPTEEEADD